MSNRPFIEFELFHPSQISPWNNIECNDPHLTGYQLSQGSIWFNVGAQKLLEYSPEIRHHWRGTPAIADQMLGRIYMDLIEELNRFLEPIPDDLLWWMMPQSAPLPNAPGIRWWALTSHIWNASTVVDCTYLADQICDAFSGRTLSLDRLVQSPDIHFWASDKEVFVSWDNRNKIVDGMQVWTATHGVKAFPRADFLAEMQDFRGRYFDAMEQQLALVRNGALAPNIRTEVARDEEYLQSDKAKALAEYISAPAGSQRTDWSSIRIAIEKTLELTELKLT
jgi:hypothetical protein